MALRVVVASAVVSRKVGRGRNRLGAFSLAAYPGFGAPLARPRQRDHLRRRAPLHRVDAARSSVRRRVRPLEGRRRASRRCIRCRCALRRDPGRTGSRTFRSEEGCRRRPRPPRLVELRLRLGGQRGRARRRTLRPGALEHGYVGGRPRLDLGHRATRATRRGHRNGVRRCDLRRRSRACLRRRCRARRDPARLHDRRRSDTRVRRPRITRPPGRARDRIAGRAHSRVARPALRGRPVAEHASRHALRASHRADAACARRRRLGHVRDRIGLLRVRPRRGRSQPVPRTVQRPRRASSPDPRRSHCIDRRGGRPLGELDRRARRDSRLPSPRSASAASTRRVCR